MLKKHCFVKKKTPVPIFRLERGSTRPDAGLGDVGERAALLVGLGQVDGADARGGDAGQRQGGLVDAPALAEVAAERLLLHHGRRGQGTVIAADGPGSGAVLALLEEVVVVPARLDDRRAAVDLQDVAHAFDLLDRHVAERLHDAAAGAADLDRLVDAAVARLIRRRRNGHRKQGSGHEGHTQESTLHAHLLWQLLNRNG